VDEEDDESVEGKEGKVREKKGSGEAVARADGESG